MSYDYKRPSAYWETSPRARKEHSCYECRRIIPVGVYYRGIAGVWDGNFDYYSLCMRCTRLHDYTRTIGQPACFGDLLETVQEAGLQPWIDNLWKERHGARLLASLTEVAQTV